MMKISLPLSILLCSLFRLLSANMLKTVCTSPIYCTGELLYTFQTSNIFPHYNKFVHLKLLKPQKIIFNSFEALMAETDHNPNSIQLTGFIHTYFEDKEELRRWSPSDFNPFPPILNRIKNGKLLQFAKDIINIWPRLGRKVIEDVSRHPNQYSFIDVPRGFIVPGDKIKELYYWDSYWIIRGLLASNMIRTTRGMIDNFLHLVTKFGYIPTGNRIYYLGRSHPPFLTWMVSEYIDASGDKSWLEQNIETVEQELHYWLEKKLVSVEVAGRRYTLLRYSSDKNNKGPRPEAYNEDYKNAQKLPEKVRELFYTQVKSASESGWDFSSRWLVNTGLNTDFNLSTVITTKILPVDLNSIFAASLQKIGDLRSKLGHKKSAKKWWNLAEMWRDAIEHVFWDAEDGIWYDYDSRAKIRRKIFYVSCAAPLWAGAVEPWLVPERARYFVRYLQSSGALRFPGGVPTSLWHTGELFDYPNVFPPFQAMLIGALEKSDYSEARRLARQQIDNWIRVVYAGYKEWKRIFNSYNCLNPSESGGHGEYGTQHGFGWTIAYVLELLQKYGGELTVE